MMNHIESCMRVCEKAREIPHCGRHFILKTNVHQLHFFCCCFDCCCWRNRQTNGFPTAETKRAGRCCSSNWCATHISRELLLCAQGGSKCMCSSSSPRRRRGLLSRTQVRRTFSIPTRFFMEEMATWALMCDQISTRSPALSNVKMGACVWSEVAGRNREDGKTRRLSS